MQDFEKEKIFLVINLSYFGDVLLTGALCQSIKIKYPKSKVLFMTNKPLLEAAKYLEGVDDVLYIDKKKEHKGLWGLIKFASTCKYCNKIDTTFIMYGNDRGILLSYFLNSKKRISGNNNITKFLLTDYKLDFDNYMHTQDRNANFLKNITGEKILPIPIIYNPPEKAKIFPDNLLKELNYPKKLIGICLTSKKIEKDMPIEDAIKLITHLNKEKYTILYTGAGDRAKEYSENLKALGCKNFIDLTNKTTISELAATIQQCHRFISVDTGSLHLACAVKTPTLALFYINNDFHLQTWAPKSDLYNCILIKENITIENIIQKI